MSELKQQIQVGDLVEVVRFPNPLGQYIRGKIGYITEIINPLNLQINGSKLKIRVLDADSEFLPKDDIIIFHNEIRKIN